MDGGIIGVGEGRGGGERFSPSEEARTGTPDRAEERFQRTYGQVRGLAVPGDYLRHGQRSPKTGAAGSCNSHRRPRQVQVNGDIARDGRPRASLLRLPCPSRDGSDCRTWMCCVIPTESGTTDIAKKV